MRDFKINEYIILKLESARTNIYVNGEKFIQCKGIVLNRTLEELKPLIHSKSIDDLIKVADMDSDDISTETEFMVHCSNLQVWAENEYNTDLLHSNLAFPLLHKLAEVGDPIARRKFKEEIMRRLMSGAKNTIKYLVEENYIDYLDREQFWLSILKPQEAEIIINLEELLNHHFIIDFSMEYLDDTSLALTFLQRKVSKLQIMGIKLEVIPTEIKYLTSLQALYLPHNSITTLPNWISNLKNLTILDLGNCILEDITDQLGNLENLKMLNLSFNNLSKIPESIGMLNNLEVLMLAYNRLDMIPESLGKLCNLKILDLDSNLLKTLPQPISNLKSLKKLSTLGNLFP